MNENENGTSRGGRVTWPPYHWIQSGPTEDAFADFWGFQYDLHDLELHQRFIKMMGLSANGANDSEIQKKMNQNNVRKYLSGNKKHYLTTIRWQHEILGRPEQSLKWLPVHLKPRGVPEGPWISVPTEMASYRDVVRVIEQLKPTEESFRIMGDFGYGSKDELLSDRVNLYSFFGGAMAGDAGKPLKGSSRFPSNAATLILSKAKPNSYRFGGFASLSVNASLGLAMHRIRDAPQSEQRYTKSECYRWITPASPLIAWTLRVFMGLRKGEKTTYDPLRMDWLLDAPKEFKIYFLQGLLESDGWVNPGNDRVVFVSSPNEKLLTGLLSSLDVRHRLYQQRQITRIEFETELGLPLNIFSPRIHSNNHENLVTMANARRFPERKRLPTWFLETIRPIIAMKLNNAQACLEIAKLTGMKVSDHTVKKYRKSILS
jgi:hypothetical protein